MDSINPWLDPAEVRQLAERLLTSSRQNLSIPAREAGFDAEFVGFAPSPTHPVPTPVAESPPAPIPAAAPPMLPAHVVPELAEPAPIPAAAPPMLPAHVVPEPAEPAPIPAAAPPMLPAHVVPEPAEPAPTTARGPFLDRIHRFRDWLHQQFSATGIFILDREGFVIFDESGHGKLHFLARSLALTTRRPGTAPGNVHVKVGTSATLEVIPVESPYGWLVLGAVVPEPMTNTAVAAVMNALSQVTAPPATKTS